MTTDLPSTADPGDPAGNSAAQGRPRSPSSQASSVKAQSGPDTRTYPPVDQLDFQIRENERVIDSDERLKRLVALHEDRRKDERQHVAMSIVELAARTVALIVCVIVFLAGVVVLHHVLPNLSLWLAARIVGFGFLTAGGGVGIGAASQVLTTRFRGRGRGSRAG